MSTAKENCNYYYAAGPAFTTQPDPLKDEFPEPPSSWLVYRNQTDQKLINKLNVSKSFVPIEEEIDNLNLNDDNNNQVNNDILANRNEEFLSRFSPKTASRIFNENLNKIIGKEYKFKHRVNRRSPLGKCSSSYEFIKNI